MNNMAITITDAAAAEIKKIIKDQGLSAGTVLRIGIKGRNPQGFNYILDLTEASRENDIRLESQGINIVCDPESHPNLDGTELDFRDEGERRGFVFKNPHATKLPVNASGGNFEGPKPVSAAATGAAGEPPPAGGATVTSALMDKAIEADIIEKLRTIYDPEIPVNIYDLGLIYKIDISAEREVNIEMTLTAPGCPVAGSMPPAVQQAVESVDSVKAAKVNLVWEPPWTKDRMSEEAMLQLGML